MNIHPPRVTHVGESSDRADSMIHLERAERLAWWLDDRFRVPLLGWRFGLDSLLGLVPWLGDAVSALFGLYLLATAVRLRVPPIVLFRMGFHIVLDFVVGLIPVAGDVSDVFVKSNRWNLALLRAHALDHRRPGFIDYAVFVLVVGGVLVAFAVTVTITLWMLREVSHVLGILLGRAAR